MIYASYKQSKNKTLIIDYPQRFSLMFSKMTRQKSKLNFVCMSYNKMIGVNTFHCFFELNSWVNS